MNRYYVYLLSNHRDTVLYIGMTNDLKRRVWEHKHKANPKRFTVRYNCDRLVYFETYDSPERALAREKELKRYKRIQKEALIEQENATWRDLYEEL